MPFGPGGKRTGMGRRRTQSFDSGRALDYCVNSCSYNQLEVPMPRARAVAALLTLFFTCASGLAAQGAGTDRPASRPASGVLTILTVKPDVPRAEVMKVMPAEV